MKNPEKFKGQYWKVQELLIIDKFINKKQREFGIYVKMSIRIKVKIKSIQKMLPKRLKKETQNKKRQNKNNQTKSSNN